MKYLKYTAIFYIPIIVINLLLITLSYFNKYNYDLVITNSIIYLVSSFITGYIIGKESKEKAFLEGTKVGLINALISLLIRILLNKKITLFKIITYILIIIITILGSIIGINKKTETK